MEFEKFPECDCKETQVVKRLIANGKRRYEQQCQHCGKSQAIAKNKLTFKQESEAKEYEASLVEAWDKKRAEFYDEQRKKCEQLVVEKNAAWWTWYSDYLETDKWKLKSRKVIERDVVCQACLASPAQQAHHLTYDHVGNEPLFDLIGVCVRCHDKITAMDRERRKK
jgi:phage terminase large subunit GpA-like protein